MEEWKRSNTHQFLSYLARGLVFLKLVDAFNKIKTRQTLFTLLEDAEMEVRPQNVVQLSQTMQQHMWQHINIYLFFISIWSFFKSEWFFNIGLFLYFHLYGGSPLAQNTSPLTSSNSDFIPSLQLFYMWVQLEYVWEHTLQKVKQVDSKTVE